MGMVLEWEVLLRPTPGHCIRISAGVTAKASSTTTSLTFIWNADNGSQRLLRRKGHWLWWRYFAEVLSSGHRSSDIRRYRHHDDLSA